MLFRSGLFYGDAGQLVAQLMGVATLVGFVFVLSFVLNMIIEIVMGQRVTPSVELEGLDIPEMGVLAYDNLQLNELDLVGVGELKQVMSGGQSPDPSIGR